ncbi:hypothetical protein ACFY0P_19985 [Streptomyces sp. NPDC001714]|uniref:hypothetical protein n=1 Tax=Streptomyces sp. NPDC001714 TaxID=3364603 RepID=UPI00369937C2
MARRTAGLARVGRVAGPVAPHDGPVHRGPTTRCGCCRNLGVNSFANFGPGRAKQYVAVNHDGQLIGDSVLFHLEENLFDLVGHPMVLDWVQYHLETGEYDATTERDDNSYDREAGRPPKMYRYEVQGPNAVALLERVTGAPVPPVKFFHMTTFTIAGRQVRALRHGMAGQPGFELFGP